MKGLLDISVFGRFFQRPQKKSLLVALLGDVVDHEVVDLALSVSKKNSLEIVLVHAVEIPRDLPLDADLPDERKNGWEYVRQVEALLKNNRCKIEYTGLVMARDAGVAIVKEASVRDVGSIFVGLPYKYRQGTFALGSAVPNILKNANCEVVVVRQKIPNKNA